MAGGWTSDGAVNGQIADSIEDEVARARSRLPKGESLTFCEECGEEIPEARRKALPGVRLCISCQEGQDKEQVAFGYNRREARTANCAEGVCGRRREVHAVLYPLDFQQELHAPAFSGLASLPADNSARNC